MPPKQKTPAPIDRPLSRAYLREFSGWSTAFPPGLSDPASLRIMENVMVNRDGSVRLRPGLRYLSYEVLPEVVAGEQIPGFAPAEQFVGTHEAFFLNDGTKAYLFAVRENDGTVGFRVLALGPLGSVVQHLTDPGIDFSIPQGEPVLNFSAATTYVKYLQIDNKVFALSNAGETMRLFTVGATKSARKLSAIERPLFDLDDKLSVVHPDAAWAASPTVRKNLLLNPSFETNTTSWTPDALTELSRSTTVGGRNGAAAARLASLPTRTNLVPSPLYDVATTGITGWTPFSTGILNAVGADLEISLSGSGPNRIGEAQTVVFGGIVAGQSYKVAFDQTLLTAVDDFANNTISDVTPRIVVYWYNASGTLITSSYGNVAKTVARQSLTVTAPAGATSARVFIGVIDQYSSATGTNSVHHRFKNVVMVKSTESTAMFSGASGANYFWTGAANDSASVYHPPVDIKITHAKVPITAGLAYVASGYAQADPTVRNFQVGMNLYNASSVLTETEVAAAVADADAAWTRHSSVNASAVATSTQADVFVKILAVPRGEYHYVDSVMLEQAAAVATYFDGDDADTATVIYAWDGAAHGSASSESTYVAPTGVPAAETPTVNTLVSSTAANNTFNFGYFYTFSNEIGESAASQVTVVRAQRAWPAWKWEAANGAGEPNGVLITNPDLVADQLVAVMPQAVYDAAKAQGAISWSVYMLTWSNQDSVPVEGVLLGTKDITSDGAYASQGWIRHTPQTGGLDVSAQLPSAANRRNYSIPSSGGQGIVAADRLVLVDDPTEPAVIRWSSNQQGEYTNFTANRGGGYKTLTSGNLYVPSAVKLWQNPQSVDTLTILCEGTDGQSTGYYMAPASISSQSGTTSVMGFEETTATPGTTSPYGCEVLNNALYHPLDNELMKSSANNYNITHKTMTEQIEFDWVRLQNKHRIVSAQHDNRLYYIVHNPLGAELEAGCMGNEIWVFDSGKEGGTWSRWLIQAASLRKIENDSKIYMSVVRPDGIYYLDPDYNMDDKVTPGGSQAIYSEYIPWRWETNTQGANRAHDAWAHVQQVTMTLGNFQGAMRWGIRSWDINGKAVEVSKIVRDDNPRSTDLLPFDLEDHLQVRRDLKEWFLFAESIYDYDLGGAGVNVLASTGQVNYVQYRYTPVSVNVGYEYGSVETFEYGRATVNWNDRNTDAGVPTPAIDTRRP